MSGANGPSSWSTTTHASRRARARVAERVGDRAAGCRRRRRRSARRGGTARARRPACGRSARAAAGRRRGSRRRGWPGRPGRPPSSASVDGGAVGPATAGTNGRRRASRPHVTTSRTVAGTPGGDAGALRHVADPLASARNRSSGVPKSSTRPVADRVQADERLDQRRLAGAVGAEQRDDLARARPSRSTSRTIGRPPRTTPTRSQGRARAPVTTYTRWPARGRRGSAASGTGSRVRSDEVSPSIGSSTPVADAEVVGQGPGQVGGRRASRRRRWSRRRSRIRSGQVLAGAGSDGSASGESPAMGTTSRS